MSEDPSGPATPPAVELGQAIYDADGNRLGTIQAFDGTGFAVATHPDVELPPGRPDRAREFGEATLMWRCGECGEIGPIDEIPETCPACGAPEEAIYYWIED